MAQDGTTAGGSSYTIDNVTFPVGRTKLQSIFDAIRSTNIGNTAPDLVAGQFWIDNNTPSTTVWTLYFYDGTDNISFATIDTINNTVNFLDSTFDLINDTTPQLGGNLDLNSNDITGTGNINITGNLTASGNLTSLGIDDNATSTAITINSSNNVGVGTSSPANYFNYNTVTLGEGGIGSILQLDGASSGHYHLVQNNNGSMIISADQGNVVGSTTMNFLTDGSERMRISSTGHVSIGTTAPVSGLANFSQLTISGGEGGIVINSNDTGVNDYGRLVFTIGNSTGNEGLIRYNTNDYHMSFWTNAKERMRIESNGNIQFYEDTGTTAKFYWNAVTERLGIGTASPTQALDVNGASYPLVINSTTSNLYKIQFKDNGVNRGYIGCGSSAVFSFANASASELMRINTDGQVGLGFTPNLSGKRIYINSTGTSGVELLESGTRKGNFLYDTVNNWLSVGTSLAEPLRLYTNSTEHMRIDASGKVGINTTSPYGKFEVHSGGGGTNYTGSSAIKSGVSWGSESSSHTIDLWNYNEADNTSGMLLVHAKADSSKCGTLMLLFTKRVGQFVKITTISSKLDGMSTFSASTSGNSITISTDSDCAICWQSYYGV